MLIDSYPLRVCAVVLTCSAAGTLSAQQSEDPTVGLKFSDVNATPGYTLYTPLNSIWTYLIDQDGNKVHEWTDTSPGGNSVYLLDDGSLLRCSDTGPAEGGIMIAGGDGGSAGGATAGNSPLSMFRLDDDDEANCPRLVLLRLEQSRAKLNLAPRSDGLLPSLILRVLEARQLNQSST